MPRTLSAELADHLAGDTHTLATMLRLDMRDGTSLGITDHDQDLTFDLGDGAISYSSSTGILPSDVVLAAGMDASNFEASGPIGDEVTRAGVLGGRFTAARARFFFVNWAFLSQGPVRIMSGRVADAKVIGGKFTFEIRSAGDAFNQTIGRVLSPYCTYDFGDVKCTATKTAVPAAVVEVTSAFKFRTDLGGDYVDDWFNVGSIEWLTGALAGIAPIEVFDYTGANGAVELYVPLPQAPQVGDTLNLFRGCSKLRKHEDPTIPTCLSYENVINFGGHPDVPGSRQYLKTGIPGVPGA